MTNNADRKKVLLARLEELEARLHGIEDELEAPQARDWGEAAVEREDEEVLEEMSDTSQQEIEQVRAALARIEDGSYGFCVKCGKEIAPARLDIVPATPFCAACASSVS